MITFVFSESEIISLNGSIAGLKILLTFSHEFNAGGSNGRLVKKFIPARVENASVAATKFNATYRGQTTVAYIALSAYFWFLSKNTRGS